MKDFNHNEDEQIRELSLMQEEAHYHHTINALVELMIVYGSDKVLNDLKTAIGWKKAW